VHAAVSTRVQLAVVSSCCRLSGRHVAADVLEQAVVTQASAAVGAVTRPLRPAPVHHIPLGPPGDGNPAATAARQQAVRRVRWQRGRWLLPSRLACAAASQGAVHAHGAALQHGDAHRAVHPREAAARPAAAVQGEEAHLGSQNPYSYRTLLIGLCTSGKLLRALPQRFKVDVTFDAWLSRASACSCYAPCRAASSVPSHPLLRRVVRPLGAAARPAAASLGGFVSCCWHSCACLQHNTRGCEVHTDRSRSAAVTAASAV
jgi:hypothetical protein